MSLVYDPKKHIGYHHIEKTGGTSYKSFLDQHFRMMHVDKSMVHGPFERYVAKLDSAPFRFIVTIREPLSHVVSLWQYWRRFKKGMPDCILKVRGMTFREFAEYYCRYEQLVSVDDYRMWSYQKLIQVDGAMPGNMYPIRIENVANETHHLLNEQWGLGIDVAIPIMNKTVVIDGSKYQPYIAYHDEKTVDLVHEKYRWVYDEMQWYQKPQLTYEEEWCKLEEKIKPA